MASIDMTTPYDSMLSISAAGCKSGLYIPLTFQSCWACDTITTGSSFEDLIKMTYRDDGAGNLGVGFVTASRVDLACSDFSFDNVFNVMGMTLGFCIASDGCIALLLITP